MRDWHEIDIQIDVYKSWGEQHCTFHVFFDTFKKTRENLAKVFDDFHSYLAPMLVYPGANWTYTAAAKKLINKNNLDISDFVQI